MPIWLGESVAALRTIQYLKPIFKFHRAWPTGGWEAAERSASRATSHGNRTVLMRSIGGGCGQLKERRELRSCLELRDRVEVLESARERVAQAPHCSRSELLDPRVEIRVVNAPGQVFRGVELAFYEGLVDDQFRCFVRQARPLPRVYLFPHRLEVPLHAVHSN